MKRTRELGMDTREDAVYPVQEVHCKLVEGASDYACELKDLDGDTITTIPGVWSMEFFGMKKVMHEGGVVRATAWREKKPASCVNVNMVWGDVLECKQSSRREL